MDRLLLGPASAEAGAAPAVSPEPAVVASDPKAPALPASETAPTTQGGPSLAERLRDAQATMGAWDHASLREAFRPSGAWLAVLRQPETAEALPAAAADEFKSNVRLTAIVSGRGGGFVRAIIDAKTWVIPVGGEVQGFRLISIDDTGRSALFQRGDEELIFRLEEPRLGGADRAVVPEAPAPSEKPEAEQP